MPSRGQSIKTFSAVMSAVRTQGIIVRDDKPRIAGKPRPCRIMARVPGCSPLSMWEADYIGLRAEQPPLYPMLKNSKSAALTLIFGNNDSK